MDKNIYNPEKLQTAYYSCEHGTGMADKIKDAILQADLHNDIRHMFLFRAELCEEAAWYLDRADTVKVFKELLDIADSHPGTEFGGFIYHRIPWKEFLLWTYETFLDVVKSFYNIPLEECKGYINDFSKRWTAYGYDEREPYRMNLELCFETGNMEEAAGLWEKYIKMPLVFNDINKGGHLSRDTKTYAYLPTEIKYYLANNQLQKAGKILDRIQVMHTTAGIGHIYSVMSRAMRIFLEYYIINGNYEKAAEISGRLEHSNRDEKEFIFHASFMCSYVYTKTGRGMRIYRNYWEEWENEKNPQYRYYIFKNTACFFKALKKAKGTDTIKIRTGNTFPFYNEDKIYNIEMLCNYYYKKAEEIARKFDQRNGTGCYIERLEKSFANA